MPLPKIWILATALIAITAGMAGCAEEEEAADDLDPGAGDAPFDDTNDELGQDDEAFGDEETFENDTGAENETETFNETGEGNETEEV